MRSVPLIVWFPLGVPTLGGEGGEPPHDMIPRQQTMIQSRGTGIRILGCDPPG